MGARERTGSERGAPDESERPSDEAGRADAGRPAEGSPSAFEVSFESDPRAASGPVTSSLRLSQAELEAAAAGVPDARSSQRGTVVVSQASRGSQPPAGRAHTRSFADGALLAGRFRIARFLGEGGMGEVYEAEDLELRERVALKTVRPEIAGDPRAWEEFRREVHLARKVTHPNVCRIFDVFHHYDPQDGAVDVAFVTMELLPGETLQARLKREGRLTPAVVLPLARQMAAGLGAAHARGVVHRDFKGANVMLVPAEDGGAAPRAVVTDFGLARGEAGGDESYGSLHTAGRIAGTPAYMAPEQLTGGKVTPAIDVYALGAVLFELVTGRPPFVGDSPMTTAVMRLKENPPLPRTLAPDLDRRWELVLLRCLEREPSARFATPAEAVAALEERGTGLSLTLRHVARRPGRATVVAAVATGALVLGLGGLWWARRETPGAASPASPPSPEAAAPHKPARRGVAVMGFKNLTQRPEAAWISTAAAEMLGIQLSAGGRLKVAPGESVARTKRDLRLDGNESYSPETLERLRLNLGSELIVSGHYLAQGGRSELSLDVRVQDARSGEELATASARGPEGELADIVSRCGQSLRAALDVGELAAPEVAAARAAFSKNPAWARLYAEGLEKLRRYEAPEARALLERAVQADPSQALGHSWLADAWDRLGYKERARASAKRAADLAGSLPPEEALLVAARYHHANAAYAEEVEKYRALWTLRPDDLDYGLGLAMALRDSNDAPQAQNVLAALRRLPPPARDDMRIDLAEATVADKLSEWARVVELAEQAVVKGRALGASLLVAEARYRQGFAHFRMSDGDKARAAAQQARQLYEAAGDRSGAAKAISVLGHVAWQVDHRLDEAETLYSTATDVFRAAGDRSNVTFMLGLTAGIYKQRGDIEGSRRLMEQTLEVFREVGNSTGEAGALVNLGNVSLQLGAPAQARQRAQAAATLAQSIVDRTAEASAHTALGEAQRLLGDLAAARTSMERALELRTTSGEKAAVIENRAQLAGLLLDEGRVAEAAQAAQQAADAAHALGEGATEAVALEVLARARLRAGQIDRARQALQLAEERKVVDAVQHLLRRTTAARIEAAAGQRDAALSQLRDVVAKAGAERLYEPLYEARLALGELGGGGLDTLAREARQRGYLLVARRADEARRATAAR